MAVSGVESTSTAPSYYHTRPLNQGPMHPLAITRKPTPTSHQPIEVNVRTSRRLRGGTTDEGPSLEEVEKSARAMRVMIRNQNSPRKENELTPQQQSKITSSQNEESSGCVKSQESKNTDQGKNSKQTSGSSSKKSVKKSIWGRSSYRKRRKWKRKGSVKIELDDEDEGLVDLEDNNDEEDVEEEESEEEMDVEETATKGQTDKSPGMFTKRSPRQDNQEEPCQELLVKSPKRNSLTNCLNIDVNIKLPKDVQRSPCQRSPRLESPHQSDKQSTEQHSQPSILSNESTPKLHVSDSGQKSPRQRQMSGSRSPRSSDNLSHSESGHKSPRHKPCESDKVTSQNGPLNDEELTNISASNITDADNKTESVQVIVSAFDSGLGSSDSSGDSNDSAGKLISSSVLIPQNEDKEKMDTSEVYKILVVCN